MLSKILIWTIFLCLVLPSECVRLAITTTPPALLKGLGGSLAVRCEVQESAASGSIIGRRDAQSQAQDVAEVTSLVLSHDGADVATISHGKPRLLGQAPSGYSVSGLVYPTPVNQSFLQLNVAGPVDTLGGEWLCEANAMTSVGHAITMTTTYEVETNDPTNTDLMAAVQTLQQQMAQLRSPIVFSAGLSKDTILHDGSTLVYDLVYSNVGGGYDASTGRFTAPAGGVYQFQMSGMSMPGRNFWLNLFLNSQRHIISIHGAKEDWMGTSNSVSLHLNAGDYVEVIGLLGDSYLHGYAPVQVYTTLTGQLLARD